MVLDILRSLGTEVIFGLPGGTVAPFFDGLLDHDLRVVVTKHEQGAVFAAIGHARATGQVGVALVTSGPGLLNTLTALASAHADNVPVLVIAGEVSRANFGKGALQEGSAYGLDVLGMCRHVAKLAVEVNDPHRAPLLLRRALATANSGRRGPVVLTFPIDVSSAPIRAPQTSQAVTTRFELEETILDRVARSLSSSERAVIFAGSGCRQGRGPERLRAVAEALQLPVMTTPKGKGVLSEHHPLSVGVFGMGGHPSATELLQGGIDTLLAIGTSLNDIATCGWSELIRPRRELIHVDIDAAQIGRVYAPTTGIAASAEQFLEAMLARVEPVRAVRIHGVRHHAIPGSVRAGSEQRIAPQRAIFELQEILGDDALFTVDSGEHTFFAIHYLQAARHDAFMVMTGLGAMGSAVPAALGAKLAAPERPVAAICGDGGFAMAAAEVTTAALAKAPIVVAVFNDQRFGMVELGHGALYGRTPEFPLGPMDVSLLGQALGADSLVVEHPGEIIAARRFIAERPRPLVLDIRIDRSVKMPKSSRFEKLAADMAAAKRG